MDFRRFLIETQTTANQLKQLVKPEKRAEFAQLKIGVVQSLERMQGLSPKMTQLLTNFILSNGIRQNPTDWASGVNFISAMVRRECGDYLVFKKDDNTVLSQLNNADFTVERLRHDSEEWHKEIAERGKGEGPSGRSVLELSSIGWKNWNWVSLDRGYCKDEGEAAGHCGNAGAVAGDNILSLRDPQNHVRLTFIVNNGVLGEMKGRGNEKPAEKYHPAIVALLKSHLVKSVRGGGYAPENNFHLDDLNSEHRKEVEGSKPNIHYVDHVFASNDPKLFDDLLGLDNVKIDGEELVVESCDSWGELYKAIKDGNSYRNSRVEDFSWLDDPFQHHNDYTPPISDLLYHVSKENDAKLEKLLDAREEKHDDDEDEEDDKELEERIEDDYEIKNAIESAGREGEEYGTEAEAYKDVQKQLGNVTENGFYVHTEGFPYTVRINKKKVKDLWNEDQESIENSGLRELYDFRYSPPYNGYSEFDKNHFNERLSELLDELN